ncbi:MAG: 50S ribosomal protein L2, partial [Flavobacteriaceae bacterium]|nr:50S ribosomal protein L2 [Flavobacteriaceae bacterium]
MAIKKFRPITPSRRFMTVMDTSDITSKPTVRSLLKRVKAHAGRNSNGRITSRHKQAGAKKLYRIIDFKRSKFGVEGTVSTIEYDPYRNCRICLITYADGDKRYILQPSGLSVGTKIMAQESGLDILPGNAMRLTSIPVGTMVHNIEMKPGKGGQIARSAGGYAQIMGREDKYVILRLPSGEMRKILGVCIATIGIVGNEDYSNMVIGKAGRSRHLGKRPQTRGSAMNPIDHPHGGGEGKTNSGRHPV